MSWCWDGFVKEGEILFEYMQYLDKNLEELTTEFRIGIKHYLTQKFL